MTTTKTNKPETEISVRFRRRLFNNIYWHLEQAFANAALRFIWVFGGSSAAKSYSVVQLQVKLMFEQPDQNALIMRKFSVDIQDSIYKDFKDVVDRFKLTQYFTFQKHFIRCNLTGSYVRFRGLDDSEKVKGIAGFRRIILEEISQFDHADLKQVRKRLRGKRGQQIIGIFNPISVEHWIKKEVFDNETLLEQDTELAVNVKGELVVRNYPIAGKWYNDKGNTLILKTNYLDNVYIVGRWRVNADGVLEQRGGFVDQHTIDDFEKDKRTDPNYYQVYGLGNWGRIRTGGEFWKDFNMNIHQTKIGWNEKLPVFMVWDENVNPYLTCTLWQIYGTDNKRWPGKRVAVQIDEICLADPRNRVQHVCKEFKERYPLLRCRGLFVGGDRTSVKEDTKLEKGENFFTKVVQHLQEYHPTLRLQSVNPSVVQSGGFINACYRGETDLEILINEKCTKSLYDYQYALEDSDGTLLKSMVQNKVTKVRYQEFGHCSDAKRYMITTNFQNEYSTYLAGRKGTRLKVGKTAPSKNSY